jgi:PKD domain
MSDIENKNETTNQPQPTTPEIAAQAATVVPTVVPTTHDVTPPPAVVSPIIQAPIIKSSPTKGRKLSPMKLAIGCVIFFMLFVGLVMAAWYAGIKNPKALGGIMTAAQAKNLLMIVSWAFFGILFLTSFSFMWLNGYRLSKVKNWPKMKLIVWLVLSLFALMISIAVWAVVISSIQKIDAEVVYSKDLVIAKISVIASGASKSQLEEIAKSWIMAIAPVQIYLSESKNLDNAIKAKLGLNNASTYKLSCWNGENREPGQIVSVELGSENGSSNVWYIFRQPCFYTKKWEYKLILTYTYVDKVSQQNKEDKIEVGTVKIPAEMILKNDWVVLKTNDAKDELVAGDNPARIIFDAKKVFSDIGLKENLIIWNFDGKSDDSSKENKAFFSHTFSEWQLYTVYYRLPWSLYPRYYYSFPLRTLQSDVPLCTLTSSKNSDGSYSFEGNWDAWSSDIENLKFEIYSLNQERVIQTTPVQKPTLNYTFPDNQQYIARLVYNTLEKKKGFCESEVINASSEVYNTKVSLQWKATKDSTYIPFAASGATSILQGNKITATQTPFDIQLRLDSITPKLPQWATVSVQLNKQNMKAENANLYSARVYWPKQQDLELFIDDKKWNTVQKNWTIVFNQETLVGELKADKVTGNDPLTIWFDASTITATKEWDEVIYYSWDFGDGDVKKNVTQSKLSHTYIFNTTKEVGTYTASVTIQTKKWETKKFTLDTPISVKRKTTQVVISSPSHTTQVASIGDSVDFNMQTDWYITAITWDFGDGSEPYQCDGRACAQTKHAFSTSGTYSIRATVEYKWLPSSTSTLKIKVE